MSRTLGSASSRSVSVPDRGQVDEDLTLAGLLRFGLHHRRLILGSGLVALLVVTAVTLMRSRTYTSTARFMPQASKDALGQLSGLAATFGVPVPAADPGTSPEFYAELLKSRDILRRTVETRYAFATADDSMHGTLVDLFEAPGENPAARRDEAAKILLKSIEVTVGRATGTIDLDVTTPWAELSQQVASRMIQLVSDFNLHRRQTTAGAERRFAEARVAEARDSLRVAEVRQEGFLQRNRDYRNSPQLLLEFDRLQREVTMRQQLYTSLAQSYEGARIDEVRNTPLITLIEAADLPARPDPRLALVKGMLAGLVGLGLGSFIAAVRQAFGGAFGGVLVPPRVAEPARTLGSTAAKPDGL
jgi:uncharacterized protein involved in exopolysaccharide biosynthesis